MRYILTDEKLLRRIERTNVVYLLAFTAVALVLFSARTGLGVFLGGIISILSFHALKWQLRRSFQYRDRVPSAGRLFVSYYLRYLAVAYIVFTAIYYKWVHPISLVVGLSVVVASVVSVGIIEVFVMLQRGEK